MSIIYPSQQPEVISQEEIKLFLQLLERLTEAVEKIAADYDKVNRITRRYI